MLEKINKLGKSKFFFKKPTSLQSYKSDKFLSLLLPRDQSNKESIGGGARYNGLFKNSLNEFPLISIVMPNFKEKNISKAIDSILDQNYQNIDLLFFFLEIAQIPHYLKNNFLFLNNQKHALKFFLQI